MTTATRDLLLVFALGFAVGVAVLFAYGSTRPGATACEAYAALAEPMSDEAVGLIMIGEGTGPLSSPRLVELRRLFDECADSAR